MPAHSGDMARPEVACRLTEQGSASFATAVNSGALAESAVEGHAEQIERYIEQLVDAAPPLTAGQRQRIRVLLRP
jgi:hypothetical protein